MARTLASLLVRLDGDDRGLQKTFDNAKKGAVSFSDFANRASGTILAIGAAAIGAGAKLLTMSGAAEQTKVSFEVFTGSASKAKELLDQLNTDSIPSPFTPEQYQKAAKTLLGFGDSVDTVRGSLRNLGEAAAATGAKDLSGLSLVYGQIIAQQRAFTQDLNQFINQGIPIFDLLADVIQRPKSEIKALAAEGKITADVVEQAFAKAAAAGGRFEGAMDKQSKTLNGLLSILQGNFEAKMRDLGDTLLPGAKVAVEALNTAVDDLGEGLNNLAEDGTLNQISAGFIAIAQSSDLLAKNIRAGLGPLIAIKNVMDGDLKKAAENLFAPFNRLNTLFDDYATVADRYDTALQDLNQTMLETRLGGRNFDFLKKGKEDTDKIIKPTEQFKLKLEELTPWFDIAGNGLSSATERMNKFKEAMAGTTITFDEFLKRTGNVDAAALDPLSNISSFDQGAALPALGAGDNIAEISPRQSQEELAALRNELILTQEAAASFGAVFGNAFANIPDLIGASIAQAETFEDVWRSVGKGLKDIFKQLLADLVKVLIKTLILKTITALLAPGADQAAGGGGGGFLSGLFGGFGAPSGLLGSGVTGGGLEIFGNLRGQDIFLSNKGTGRLFGRIGG